MSNMQVKFDDKALQKLKKQLKDTEIKVGLPKGTPQNSEGISLIEIGAVQEYGSPAKGIPERSFIRVPLDDARNEYIKVAKNNAILVLEGKQTLDTAIEKLGIWGSNVIKKAFTNNDWKPNSEKTIARKGSSKPLIDTGLLRQSITWEVKK